MFTFHIAFLLSASLYFSPSFSILSSLRLFRIFFLSFISSLPSFFLSFFLRFFLSLSIHTSFFFISSMTSTIHSLVWLISDELKGPVQKGLGSTLTNF
jgi:hypothetical protein